MAAADLKKLEEEQAEKDREALKMKRGRQERKIEALRERLKETEAAIEVTEKRSSSLKHPIGCDKESQEVV